jgi:predicted small lipoprotein YifL
MTGRSKAATIAAIALLLLGVSGCGQMGPLTLPDDVSDDADEDSDDANDR